MLNPELPELWELLTKSPKMRTSIAPGATSNLKRFSKKYSRTSILVPSILVTRPILVTLPWVRKHVT